MKYVMMPLAAVLLLPLGASPSFAQTVKPIAFARGTSSASLSGSIKGENYVDYRIVVRAGQTLTIALNTTAGNPYFNLMEPGAADVAIYNSSTADPHYSGTTVHDGAYTIRVYQMRASGRRGEVASFQLSVAVTGGASGGDVPTHHSDDALVPGTPYHATSVIPCRTAEGMAMSSCKAGVIRRPGSATVHLDTPDGGERTILFRGDAAVSSDSENMMRVERRGDTSIVRIGDVEHYEIPDALIFGG